MSPFWSVKYTTVLAIVPFIAGFIDLPPEQYDRAPDVQVNITTMPYMKIDRVCRWPMQSAEGEGGRIEGCARFLGKVCYVVVPSVDGVLVTKATQQRLLRHELAHCNGWPADHPGARR